MLNTIAARCAICAYHLKQVHVTRTQSQSGSSVQLALDTHGVGGVHDIVDTALLTQADGYRVDTHGESLFQGNERVGESSVGIGWCPCHFLAVVHHFHREELVLTCVARGDALIHSLGIYEEFECRTRLTHSRNLVVLPSLEVNVAYPCLYVSGLWLDGYKSAMHKALHIA